MKALLLTIFIAGSFAGQGQDTLQNDSVRNAAGEEVFIRVDQNATPPEGMGKLYATLSRIMRYPAEARRRGIEGKVYVEFLVNKDGSLSDIKVDQGIGGGCDEEAVRVFQEYAKTHRWTPPAAAGTPARQRIIMPLSFKLR